MSRPKADPVERVATAYLALTTDQQIEVDRLIRIIRNTSEPKPPRRRKPKEPEAQPAE